MLVQSVKPRTGTPMEALNFNSHTDSLAVKNLPASLIDLDTVPGAQLIIHSRDGECGERCGSHGLTIFKNLETFNGGDHGALSNEFDIIDDAACRALNGFLRH